MGQTLSEPVTAKETASCGNSYVKVGSSCMQGWRINMEDAHTHLLAIPDDKEACFFAVYDGHGGAKVAQYAGNHLHKKIIQSEAYAQGRIEDAIREGFLRLDEDMIKDEEMKDEIAGTTAVIVLVKGGKMYCGNVGDSRAVASCSGLAEPLSFDHKPANEEEAKRIIAAGGWVEFNRVNGNLALSRALGDFIFKRNDDKSAEEQIVTAFPDVVVRDITDDHEFILLACDGIWDVMTNQEGVDFCRDRIAAGMEPEAVCEELLTRCLAPDCQMGGLGCDNMTVVLVCLLQNQGSEVLRQKCARPRRPSPVASPPSPDPSFDGEEEPDDTFATRLFGTPSASMAPTSDGRAVGVLDNVVGEQTVPEVIRESSSDSEPAVSPVKKGKTYRMYLGLGGLLDGCGHPEMEIGLLQQQNEQISVPMEERHNQQSDDEDAPPDVFLSESGTVDDCREAHGGAGAAAAAAAASADAECVESKSTMGTNNTALPSSMDTTTAPAPSPTAEQRQKQDNDENR